jgi:beta-1,4-mannosyl-glycoprotein beta-1,4-N-acetylglucosaminyltransferase
MGRPRIWDAFIFSNEFDCLEMRLHELEGHVDRHLLLEANGTFQGAEKEGAQRNAIVPVLERAGAEPEDWVLLSDADEIPSGAVIEEIAREGSLYFPQLSFEQALCFYFANNLCTSMPWHGTQLLSLAELKERTPQQARDLRNLVPTVEGGWHFCNLGDAAFLREKIQSFSHTELNRPEIVDLENLERHIRERTVIEPPKDFPMTFELDDELPPDWVKQNRPDLYAEHEVPA